MAVSEQRRRRGDLAPNPRLWAALEEGKKLTRILTDFYTRVYADPRLAPFFHNVTKQRAIEKQYSFLMEIFTGERVYFGERPRNAHHWMVISDELFDYREELMVDCLRRHGLTEDLVREWRSVEEVFRKQIVKDKPLKKKIGGIELPLEGFEELVLTAGTLCDGCQAACDMGARVSYHLRTGKTYCASCAESVAPEAKR